VILQLKIAKVPDAELPVFKRLMVLIYGVEISELMCGVLIMVAE